MGEREEKQEERSKYNKRYFERGNEDLTSC